MTHDKVATRVWVLHPDIKSDRDRRASGPALDEAVSLAKALPSLEIIGQTIVPLPKPQPGRLFGSGKVDELGQVFKSNDIELVMIDGPLTPVQQRNLEKDWGVKILDRTSLILEIFSDRAATREGVLQVEMAALSYQRTRLVRAWTHLERQRGGLGFVGGPGETQIEADRRAIDEQLVRLRRQLAKVVKIRTLHRAARAKIPYPIVALVGYTNAGKSTLFNRLTGADVMAKDMLFATLDPTMRSVRLENGIDVILSDTVGFISDLPTELVAAFRATLEEVLSADLILHVRDISHPATQEQSDDVLDILNTLGVNGETPLIEVWNKVDQLLPEDMAAMQNTAARRENLCAISAVTGQGLDQLLSAIAQGLGLDKSRDTLFVPYYDGKKRAWLFEQGIIDSQSDTDEGTEFIVQWTPKQQAHFRKL